ncbi:hypothetical protein D3C81_2028980 [compost metagenome]
MKSSEYSRKNEALASKQIQLHSGAPEYSRILPCQKGPVLMKTGPFAACRRPLFSSGEGFRRSRDVISQPDLLAFEHPQMEIVFRKGSSKGGVN